MLFRSNQHVSHPTAVGNARPRFPWGGLLATGLAATFLSVPFGIAPAQAQGYVRELTPEERAELARRPPPETVFVGAEGARGRMGPGGLRIKLAARQPDVTAGRIHTQCLLRWHDSHQFHSARTIIRWNYQAHKQTWKKLEHCVRLDVTGPIDVAGLAKRYVQSCVNKGLNDDRTEHLLKLLIAIVADVNGTGGGATFAAVSDYVDNVANVTLGCLTDSAQMQTFLAAKAADTINASVRKESHWVYWDL